MGRDPMAPSALMAALRTPLLLPEEKGGMRGMPVGTMGAKAEVTRVFSSEWTVQEKQNANQRKSR